MSTPLYFESHVTIEPVFDERLDQLRQVCERHRFRVADLLMKKRKADSATRSAFDTFCTGRGQDADELRQRMEDLVHELQTEGFQVWRFKLEAALVDTHLRG